MGKKIRRLILNTLDIIDYLKGVISRIIKTLVQSTVICFPLVITFMLINSFLGTYIRFGFYLKLAIVYNIYSSSTYIMWIKIQGYFYKTCQGL